MSVNEDEKDGTQTQTEVLEDDFLAEVNQQDIDWENMTCLSCD